MMNSRQKSGRLIVDTVCIPIGSISIVHYLPTCLVDFYGNININVRLYQTIHGSYGVYIRMIPPASNSTANEGFYIFYRRFHPGAHLYHSVYGIR